MQHLCTREYAPVREPSILKVALRSFTVGTPDMQAQQAGPPNLRSVSLTEYRTDTIWPSPSRPEWA